MEALLLCWKGNPELAPPTRKHRWCHQVDRDALSLRQPPPPKVLSSRVPRKGHFSSCACLCCINNQLTKTLV